MLLGRILTYPSSPDDRATGDVSSHEITYPNQSSSSRGRLELNRQSQQTTWEREKKREKNYIYKARPNRSLEATDGGAEALHCNDGTQSKMCSSMCPYDWSHSKTFWGRAAVETQEGLILFSAHLFRSESFESVNPTRHQICMSCVFHRRKRLVRKSRFLLAFPCIFTPETANTLLPCLMFPKQSSIVRWICVITPTCVWLNAHSWSFFHNKTIDRDVSNN